MDRCETCGAELVLTPYYYGFHLVCPNRNDGRHYHRTITATDSTEEWRCPLQPQEASDG